ncbi:hypothetical protein CGCF413_v012092 [Colletotrichum fructicola]|nr:hypothetical protein CGCF413_v012092 [Colletotrichum fructicola]
MLCDVCKDGIEGIWDPSRTKRVGKLEEFEAQRRSRLDEPRDGFAEYWSSLSEDRDNFGDLEPNECLFIHHKTAASFMASVHEGCAMCNDSRVLFDIPNSPQEQEEYSRCYFSVFSIDIHWKYSWFRITISGKAYGTMTHAIDAIDIKADHNINFDFEASTNSATARPREPASTELHRGLGHVLTGK